MRTRNSIRNVIASLSSNIIYIIVGIIAQSIFIRSLGNEYLGLNGLFNNIISMIGIAELGIGTAITFHLYKPIVEDDKKKIVQLINFYKKCYCVLFFVILLLGIFIMPILRYIIDFSTITISVNIYIIYILFLLDLAVSYMSAYKTSILYANQKNYIVNYIHMSYIILLNTIQILVLIFFKNYYLYLIFKIIMRLFENLLLYLIINKKYMFLKSTQTEKLEKNTINDILKKVKGLIYHKIGTFIIFSTDNIIISKYIGLKAVGLYSNYYLIINSVQNIFGQIISSTTASVGNLLVTEQCDKQFEVFNTIRFINFWISSFSATAILVIMDSFVNIWLGKEYILSLDVLIILIIVYYFNSTRAIYGSFKEAAGIQYEDRHVPIIESIIKIVFSIVFAKKYGLFGVFLGSVLSECVIWLYSYPKYIYKKLFKRSYLKYYFETFSYFVLFALISSITFVLSKQVTINNNYYYFFFNIIISVLIPNILIIIAFFRRKAFIKTFTILKNTIKKNK